MGNSITEAGKGILQAIKDPVAKAAKFERASWFKGTTGEIVNAFWGKRVVNGGYLRNLSTGLGNLVTSPLRAIGFSFKEAVKGGAKGIGNGAVWVAKKPVVVALNATAWGVRVAKAHPILAGGAALVGGTMWWSSSSRRSAEQSTRLQALQQSAAMQSPYMNAVSPQEYAAMESRMKGSSGPAGGFADAVQARQSAQQGQATIS